MTTSYPIVLSWRLPSEEGRRHLPPGPTYVTVSHFENQAAISPDESWSIVIEFHDPPAYGTPQKAYARFLAPDAPDELMCVGARFELLEGKRVVAVGKVIGEP